MRHRFLKITEEMILSVFWPSKKTIAGHFASVTGDFMHIKQKWQSKREAGALQIAVM